MPLDDQRNQIGRQHLRRRGVDWLPTIAFAAMCCGACLFGALAIPLVWNCVAPLALLGSNETASDPGWGSLFLLMITSCGVVAAALAISLPVALGAGIYLQEYARKTRIRGILERGLQFGAGLPTVLVGMLALYLFFHAPTSGPKWWWAAVCLSVVMLPSEILAVHRGLATVPAIVRESAYALGATRWQTLVTQVLPSARAPLAMGITGSVIRALGETSVLLAVGFGFRETSGGTPGLLTPRIFALASGGQPSGTQFGAGGVLILLGLLLCVYGLAMVVFRQGSMGLPGGFGPRDELW